LHFPESFPIKSFYNKRITIGLKGIKVERNVIFHPERYYVDDSCPAKGKHKIDGQFYLQNPIDTSPDGIKS
jgi:hypothetical protein